MLHTLRAVDRDDETLVALKMLAGFHDDIAKDATRTKNRLRSVLTQIHPALERVFAGEILTRTLGAGLANPLRRSDKTDRRRSRPGPEVDAQPRQEGPCCPG